MSQLGAPGSVGIPFTQPLSSKMNVIHIRGTVTKVMQDFFNTTLQAWHMHFDVRIDTDLNDSNQNLPGQNVFLAVRYGDSMGYAKRIDNLQVNVPIEVQGEYIDASKASPAVDNSNPTLPVLHFTHHPVGFIVYQGVRYS
jgi:hypothetical protein